MIVTRVKCSYADKYQAKVAPTCKCCVCTNKWLEAERERETPGVRPQISRVYTKMLDPNSAGVKFRNAMNDIHPGIFP